MLLAYLPHLVLDGAVLAAHAVGARDAIVAVDRTTYDVVAYAMSERRHAQVDGGVALRAVRVPERFVSGEETALVQFLNGGPALPTFTPPRPFERGVGGAPTLVQNVETLAHLALIARFGPEWFRGIGTGDEPGSSLVTLSGAVGSRVSSSSPSELRCAISSRRREARPPSWARFSSAATSAPGCPPPRHWPRRCRTRVSRRSAARSARVRSSRCRRRRAA